MSDEQQSPRNRSVEILTSIDQTLKSILRALSSGDEIADDKELDSKYGDPEVRFDKVKNWTGPSMKGRRYSQCPPEYLDHLARLLDWIAEQAEKNDERTAQGKPVAPYRRADARRARGWAKRMRDGRHPIPRIDYDDDGYDVEPRF